MGAIPKIVVITAAMALVLLTTWSDKRAPTRYEVPMAVKQADEPVFASHWVSRGETREAHSANIGLRENAPFTVWYGGTEEGHADVALFFSSFDGKTWSPATRITDRAQTEAGLDRYIRKIGNPATHVWPDGSIGLFYVAVSVGGWGASTINYMESRDGGSTWNQPKRIVTSPFLNISTLVRTQPVVHQDGTIELPVYHEFIGKFAESLHLDRDIKVLEKRRISWGQDALQPAVVAVAETEALALLRHAVDENGRVLLSLSNDTGLSWSSPTALSLPNPNAAVAALNLGDGQILMALNDTEDGRHKLSLARSSPGNDWRIIRVLEEESAIADPDFEFSYPSMIRDEAGLIHLVYTWNQKRIKHVVFNEGWLTGGPEV